MVRGETYCLDRILGSFFNPHDGGRKKYHRQKFNSTSSKKSQKKQI